MARRRQLGLFGENTVGPATPPEAVRTLARRLAPSLYFGTSSWSFPGWKSIVFDRAAGKADLARDGLAAYAQHPLLRTVSLDRTYYAPLAEEGFRNYAQAVPDSFRFLVKAHRECTFKRASNPRYLDAAFAINEIVGPFQHGLGRRAGALVFQFPPLRHPQKVEPFADDIYDFLSALPAGALYAVEIRHTDWLTPRFAEALRDANAVPCLAVHPSMPSIERQRAIYESVSTPRAWIVRWMLGGGLEYEDARDRYAPFDRLAAPDPPARRAIATLCKDAVAQDTPAFVAINNKAEGSAPLSVIALAQAISKA